MSKTMERINRCEKHDATYITEEGSMFDRCFVCVFEENATLKDRVEELEQECVDRQDTEDSLTKWVVDLGGKSKWFITSLGYGPIFLHHPRRFGEYVGDFMGVEFRCVGYFNTLEDALECVEKDWGDLNEVGGYQYLVLEKNEPHLYPSNHCKEDRFFWRFGGRWMEIGRPHWAKRTCNWGIG